jgi:hypothetical protein
MRESAEPYRTASCLHKSGEGTSRPTHSRRLLWMPCTGIVEILGVSNLRSPMGISRFPTRRFCSLKQVESCGKVLVLPNKVPSFFHVEGQIFAAGGLTVRATVSGMVSQGLDREPFWLAHPAELLAIRTHTADEIPIVGRQPGNTRKRLAYTSRIRIRTGRLNVGRVHPLPNLPLLSCRETRLEASLTHGKEEKLLVWGQ